MRVVDETWRLVCSAVRVYGIEVHVTNVTDEPVILTEYWIQPYIGVAPRPPPADKVWTGVNAALKELKMAHKSELFADEITVPATGWVTR
jgi:hypothetical protein